jgi:arylsulfatase A-like enzyme
MTGRLRSSPSLLGALLLLAGACAPVQAEAARPPVLLVGVDGLEWKVLLRMIAEGRLPQLADLMERGVFGWLATDQPTFSPRLWATIATGKPPEEHGILGFVWRNPERHRQRRLYTSLDRRTKAFWNILSDHGVASDTIGWWTTFPAEEVDGFMVSQTNTRSREGGNMKGSLLRGVPHQVHPPERQEAVLAALEENERILPELEARIFGDFPEPLTAEEAEDWASCRWAFRADATYLAVALEQARSPDRGSVTSIYFGATDVLGHMYWDAFEPEPYGLSPESRRVQLFARTLTSYYAFVDDAIGQLLATLPPDATVLVVSDHGIGTPPEVLAGGPEQWRAHPGDHGHGPAGVVIAAGHGILSRRSAAPPVASPPRLEDLQEIGHIADVCPTLLALLDLPVGEDMQGKVMEGLVDPAFLDAHPIRGVPTHDDPEWLASRPDPAQVQPPEADERVAQLEALGYIEAEEKELRRASQAPAQE